MATYAIGDIQGCFTSLVCLLEKLSFSPSKDRLWVAGDLVNRGPESLETLDYLYSIRHSCDVVLGNHDLHLLAVARGAKTIGRKDTFDDILSAPQSGRLLDWLQDQPLLHSSDDDKYLMVHAGIPPIWDIGQAKAYAAEIQALLLSENSGKYFKRMYGDEPVCWRDDLSGYERSKVITNYFTRMRFCTEQGELDLKDKSSKTSLREGYLPWFLFRNKLPIHSKLLFGHWAALEGHTGLEQIVALDTGCVWGGRLTALELESGKVTRCRCQY